MREISKIPGEIMETAKEGLRIIHEKILPDPLKQDHERWARIHDLKERAGQHLPMTLEEQQELAKLQAKEAGRKEAGYPDF